MPLSGWNGHAPWSMLLPSDNGSALRVEVHELMGT